MYNELRYNLLRMIFVMKVVLLSWPMNAQIQVSGDIQVSEITPLEYERAYKYRLKQPRFHRKGKNVSKLIMASERDLRDSLMYYGLNSFKGFFVCQRINLEKEKNSQYLITIHFPIQSYSYIYNRQFERVSNAIWSGGVFDGCWYVAEKGFDSDEYVHLRIYNLSQSANLCAEIKEASFDYFLPCFDDKESYFFDKSHDFFFTIMKKWEGPCKYYKVTTQKLRSTPKC